MKSRTFWVNSASEGLLAAMLKTRFSDDLEMKENYKNIWKNEKDK